MSQRPSTTTSSNGSQRFKYTALITGGTAGLGYEAALSIAKSHPDWQIIIASRKDTDDASARMNKAVSSSASSSTPKANARIENEAQVKFLPLDLSSLSNVRTFVSTYESQSNPPIKALLLNAGLQIMTFQQSEDGYEKTFAVNHLGHALLFHLLFDKLAPDARIVVTSSGTHDPAQNSGMPVPVYGSADACAKFGSAEGEKYDGQQRYSTSKLVNVLWTYAVAKRLTNASVSVSATQKKNITINAFDPGLMPGTGLAREYNWFLRAVWSGLLPRLIWLLRIVMFPNVHTTKESGGALAALAIDEKFEGVSGKYFEGTREIESSVESLDEGKQAELFEWSVKAVSKDEGERVRFEQLE